MDLKKILKDIELEWNSYQKLITETLSGEIQLLNELNQYILSNSGKQIRPLLGILAAKASGTINTTVIKSVTAAEMLHNATLLHDDVADNASCRRGQPTVQSVYDPKVSVLIGDYWISKSFSLLASLKSHTVLEIFSDTVVDLSKGEIFQLQKTQALDTSKEDYFSIIASKTSSLFVAAITSAVHASGAPESVVFRMKEYAYTLGIAFQIKDDIFDYSPLLNTGKPTGGDIKERKLTLPVILTFEKCLPEEKSTLLAKLRNPNTDETELLETTVNLVNKYKGLDLAQKILDTHINKAINILNELECSIYREHLKSITQYLGYRDN